MSVGPLTDTVVSLNLPMVTAVNYARRSFMMEFGLSDMLATIEAKLFLKRTVGELLFDGYEDPILEIGASFDDEERTLPIDKFGWFYKVKHLSLEVYTSVTSNNNFRGTGPAGLTGLCGCTPARATWTGSATS